MIVQSKAFSESDFSYKLVSIGMPVYNGEKHLAKSIESLLAQTYSDFVLIISDNASTDKTKEICSYYARSDERVIYIRQPVNQGVIKNFEFVLNEAKSPYFMWAAADDLWYPEFIEKNLQVLKNNPEVVASISQVKMERLINRDPYLVGTFSLRGTYEERLRQFFRCLGANSRFYGLYRREAIQSSFVPLTFMGGMDGATLIRVIEFGDFYELQEVLMERSCYGTSNKLLVDQFKDYEIKGMEKLFPLFRLSMWFWKNTSAKTFLKCMDCVLKLNLFFSMIVLSEVTGVRQLARKLKADS